MRDGWRVRLRAARFALEWTDVRYTLQTDGAKMKRATLYVDQCGNKFWATTVKELRSKVDGGGSRVSPMYCDTTDGRTVRVGYVVGRHWLNAFAPVEVEVAQ